MGAVLTTRGRLPERSEAAAWTRQHDLTAFQGRERTLDRLGRRVRDGSNSPTPSAVRLTGRPGRADVEREYG